MNVAKASILNLLQKKISHCVISLHEKPYLFYFLNTDIFTSYYLLSFLHPENERDALYENI